MAERIMTEKQIKAHRKRMQDMRDKKGFKPPRVVRDRHCTKSKHGKGIDPDKTQEYETRFSNIWVAIKELESRVIELESKEG